MAAIKRIRSLKGVGILADKSTKDQGPDFLKVNLIYGFNGSGKSTLSRVFACLQHGQHDELLDECAFEVELDDGTTYGSPKKLQGLEERVCVFNTDFVTRSLQWEEGTASSIFYLSQEQAGLVNQLKDNEKQRPIKDAELEGLKKTAKASNKVLSTYCTERAKTIHKGLHLGTRKYEAPKLKADYASQPFGDADILPPAKLVALEEAVSRATPSPPIGPLELDPGKLMSAVGQAIELAGMSLGAVVLEEMEAHPKMVPWVKEGHEYHMANGLKTCLLCQNAFTDARKSQLAAAFDDKLSEFIGRVGDAKAGTLSLRSASALNSQTWPKTVEFDPSLQATYEEGLKVYEATAAAAASLLDEAATAMSERLDQPTKIVKHALPGMQDVNTSMNGLSEALKAVNALIEDHNATVENFSKRQEETREAILRHYLADGLATYKAAKYAADADTAAEERADAELLAIDQTIGDLKAKVRAHGPAASKITKLVYDYLGHKELTIVAADQGYSLHRNGKPVKGQPSEGEKTAIALCYFLTTLESEGRALKDLIVVVDDPISSLDTKAMNYACALVLRKLEKAKQLFVLTHNQHCMNEFKKAWMSAAYPRKAETVPTGRLLYMDVKLAEGSTSRSANIVEMSHLLREYDSEYHFLCNKILEFEAAGNDYSPNLLLMPNAMRRVLEIFLAFKVPGTNPIKQKLKSLSDRYPDDLDAVRIVALERLSQVESHSDSLDDLTGYSPMILEEVRQTCTTLLELMAVADEAHTTAIRKQCKAA